MEIPYTVTARPDTGLWNAKIGIWLFLASEVMLFGGLFSAYILLRVGATPFLARVTRSSIERLGLRPGLDIFTIIKAINVEPRKHTAID